MESKGKKVIAKALPEVISPGKDCFALNDIRDKAVLLWYYVMLCRFTILSYQGRQESMGSKEMFQL